MKAMRLDRISRLDQNPRPLEPVDRPTPRPGDREIRIKVAACGVCHTELDEIEGRTAPPVLPVIPGHQVVGRVESLGPRCQRFKPGDRVGVAWIFSACGACAFCRSGLENLCPDFKATGRDVDGGYAEYMVVGEPFAHPIPDRFTPSQAAPLLCAGAIGYRSMMLSGVFNGATLGLTGFGASAHLVLKMAQHKFPDTHVLVFARNPREREFARELGASWTGDTGDTPPGQVDALIDTTPAWRPVIAGLKHLKPGGRLVINAIRKEQKDKAALLEFDYPVHLWLEKEIKSVANVTRKDVRDFLSIAAKIPLIPEVQEFELTAANQALIELKQRKIRGAKVLRIDPSQ